MPLKLEKSDRRLLIWAGVILLPLIIILAVLSDEQEESAVPSTYSAQSQGTKAAYLLLKEEGYAVERWEKPPADLPQDQRAAHTVLVLAVPTASPKRDERNQLQTFAARGGRIIAVGPSAAAFLAQAEVESELVRLPDGKEYQPELLTDLTRGGAIAMSPAGYWKHSGTSYLVHYADGNHPIVVSYKIGKGEVIWWAASTPLTNLGITRAGNLALLLNSLGRDRNEHILWDEYFHGYHETFSGYLAEQPLRYGLLQCGLIVLGLLLTFSRRNTPIYPADDPPRLSPLEFVHTLGGLYRRARTNHAALEVPYNRFRALATRQLGLRPDTSPEDMARAFADRMGYKDEGFPKLLRKIEALLREGNLKEQPVLKLVQELNHHMLKLKLIGNG